MGVTIHYTGQLRNPARLEAVITAAEEFARDLRWSFERIQSANGQYLAGFVAYPHQDCEPLRFEFEPDFKVRSWVKTQFAGPEVHVQIVSFLRRLRPIIGRLGVRDEGEFWETESKDKLCAHIDTINQILAEMKLEKPSICVKVHEPNGRITDVIG